jgi:hypothetical protein
MITYYNGDGEVMATSGGKPSGRAAPRRLLHPSEPGLFAKAIAFLKALFGPRVRRAERQRRLAACATCSARWTQQGKDYCGACGCPRWRFAELKTKAGMARATCPLAKWGETKDGRSDGDGQTGS